MLHTDNAERKVTDISITSEALEIINTDISLQNKKTTVLFREYWHKGVVGIVASRLIETYYRPTIILTQSGDIASGSARSVPGFNLHDAIDACKEYLLVYGGHFAAAGLSLLPENIEAFTNKFEEVVSKTIPEHLLIPEIIIDTEIYFSDLTKNFYQIIGQMEPFGPENMKPIFIAKNLRDNGKSKIVKEKHIRFVVKQNNLTFNGIGFNLAEKFSLLKKSFDLVFSLDENEYNGNVSLQLIVIDLRSSD